MADEPIDWVFRIPAHDPVERERPAPASVEARIRVARAEALEEAANICDAWAHFSAADAIRAITQTEGDTSAP